MVGISLLSAATILLPISISQSNQLPFVITQTRRKKEFKSHRVRCEERNVGEKR